MKIVGITRVRNEEHIINDVLNRVAKFVDCIVVYDDASTDRTLEICKAHPKVAIVIENKTWQTEPQERDQAEGSHRNFVYQIAKENCEADWVYYFDADEIIMPKAPLKSLAEAGPEAYRFRLYDFYITEEDKDKTWKERRWIGPEYRDILMFFKAVPGVHFYQREPVGPWGIIEMGGDVRHYGKAISIDEWEKTCDYYVRHIGGQYLPKFTRKWEARKGKAIHTISDFGKPLILWEERTEKGIPLEDNQ